MFQESTDSKDLSEIAEDGREEAQGDLLMRIEAPETDAFASFDMSKAIDMAPEIDMRQI